MDSLPGEDWSQVGTDLPRPPIQVLPQSPPGTAEFSSGLRKAHVSKDLHSVGAAFTREVSDPQV